MVYTFDGNLWHKKKNMPFENKSVMEQRLEFCLLAIKRTMSFNMLCDRFNISRPTGYKWLSRYQLYGLEGLIDLSKRPKNFPSKIPQDIEDYIVKQRKEDDPWGAKKIHKILKDKQASGEYPFDYLPCKNTLMKVFERNGLINDEKRHKKEDWQRFEHKLPNNLWQMDFKGDFKLLDRTTCYPLTILDDHSRFNIGLFACKNQKNKTVQDHLVYVFRKYGLPEMMLCDNGPPWGSFGHDRENLHSYTKLEKWFIRLDIHPVHGHPYHPQTQGKDERFHRTLNEEVISRKILEDHNYCQNQFDYFRDRYNCKRPHEAIDFNYPVNRYYPSQRSYPETLPPIEYDLSDMVMKVHDGGKIRFKSKEYRIGKAFTGDLVALRKTEIEDQYDVYFCTRKIKTIITSKV
jgi:transposase InsO family protein